MTVGGWLLFIILVIFILIIFVGGGFCLNEIFGAFCGLIISVLLSIGLFAGMSWYYNETASGNRALKSQESNFNMGINRKVTVYDMEGDVIQEYEGKFDIEYDNDRILFDDENGRRHIIYYPTGTVIIDEIGD